MTPADWANRALSGEPVWNLGQIDRAAVRALDRLVHAGRLAKSRRSWMFISPPKTVWHLPEQAVYC